MMTRHGFMSASVLLLNMSQVSEVHHQYEEVPSPSDAWGGVDCFI